MLFHDRSEAGRLLSEKLAHYADRSDVVIVALPRGGVPVGYEIAKALRVPLDVLVVRKLGIPGNSEFAMGAIAAGNVRLLDEKVIRDLQITPAQIEAVSYENQLDLLRQEQVYKDCRYHTIAQDRHVILTDDGLATGWTMRAAILSLRMENPARVVIAIPVAGPSIFREFQSQSDEVICLSAPSAFHAVSQSYHEFEQVPDSIICELLEDANANFSL